MKRTEDSDKAEMRAEYDFSRGVRGKHYRRYRKGHAVRIRQEDGAVAMQYFTQEDGSVMLDPDVKAKFPDSGSVNRALRTLIQEAKARYGRTGRST